MRFRACIKKALKDNVETDADIELINDLTQRELDILGVIMDLYSTEEGIQDAADVIMTLARRK